MFRNWMQVSAVPLLVTALWITGCSDQPAPSDRLLGPDAASFAKDKENEGKEKEKKVKVKKKNGEGAGEAALVQGVLPVNLRGKVEKAEIGPKGGKLELAGHTLIVPEGAVSQKTRFTMKLFTKTIDSGGSGSDDNATYIGVELRASTYDCDADGHGDRAEPRSGCAEIDEGVRGFKVPVELSLSYALAKSFDPVTGNPADLSVIWLEKPDLAELQPTVPVASEKRVKALLDHFSDYLLAMPRYSRRR